MQQIKTSDYRPDIDGLRALAVLAVVLFHANFSGMTGGYVGVDVFFVISGMLITSIIMRDLEFEQFSVTRFYERRIRRIFPALFAMLAVSVLVGWFLLLPEDLAYMARNAFGAAAFVSNFAYWMQAGYFEGDAQTRVLLHTWSIAVEEQFYIFYPPILWAAHRYARRHLTAIVLVLALTSFTASQFVMPVDGSAAFYLTPFRAWEFLLGACLALGVFPPTNENPALRDGLSIAGAALILAAILIFDDLTRFPGVAAMVPCAGTALLIHAGPQSVCGRLLSVRPLRFIGKISYSVYLWHWPLFVFVNYYVIEKLTPAQSLGLAALSVLIGAVSWRYVETPFRKSYIARKSASREAFVLAGWLIAITCGTSAFIYLNRGLPERFPRQSVQLASYVGSMNPMSDKCGDVTLQLAPQSPCSIGSTPNASVLLWGDSHAGALYGAMRQISDNGPSITYGATPQCPPLMDLGTGPVCLEANRRKLEYVVSHDEIRTVVLAARWSLYLEGRFISGGDAETNGSVPQLMSPDKVAYPLFSDSARHEFRDSLTRLVQVLLKHGKHVVLVYPVPETGYNIPATLALMSSRGEKPGDFTIPYSLYVERQWHAIRILDSLGRNALVARVYPAREFCKGSQCITYANGTPLYFDSHHLSIPGALRLEPALRRAISRSQLVESRVGGRSLAQPPVALMAHGPASLSGAP